MARSYNAASRPRPLRAHLPGVFARLGLLDLLARKHRVFVFSYHSSSLIPGNTPYVRSQPDLHRFIGRIEAYLDFFVSEIGGISQTPIELRTAVLAQRSLRSAEIVDGER
jgi:hypothetical protein